MIQNTTPQQFYLPQGIVPAMKDNSSPVLIHDNATEPLQHAGVVPVYSSIPYNPVYKTFAPKLSAVNIELNGIESPKIPEYNTYQQQIIPVYPGLTQISPQTEAQPLPQEIPHSATIGAVPPPPQYIQQEQAPKQESATKPEANSPTEQTATPKQEEIPQKKEVSQAPSQQEQEALKPLEDAINIIAPQQGTPEAAIEQQITAIKTIFKFVQVAGAINKSIIASPASAEAKKAKEKLDSLVLPKLLEQNTFLGLANIATKDTSALTGDDKNKADNIKIAAVLTLSTVQKLLKQGLKEEAAKANIPAPSMTEISGIVQVVEVAQKDTNPKVREAGLASLVMLADPQDKKDAETMRIILGEAQNDSDANVKNIASQAINLYTEKANK
ncbi:MAG: hypothetical protein WCG23_05820 [bacterium]